MLQINQDLWRQTAKQLLSESPVFGVLLAANLSTYLYGTIMPKSAYIVHLHGPQNSGKTTVLKAAASVGLQRVIPSGDLTPLDLDKTISRHIVGAVVLDDINRYLVEQHNPPYTAVLAKLTSGEMISTKASRYRVPSIALLTADRTAYIGLASEAAPVHGGCLRDRLIEIDGNEHPIFPDQDAPGVQRYGWVFDSTIGCMEPVVQAAVRRNRQKLMTLYDTWRGQYQHAIPGEEGKIDAFAYIEGGLYLIKEVLGLNGEALAGTRALLTRLVQKTVFDQFLRIPSEHGSSAPMDSWAVQVQRNVLTYGMPSGGINTTVLAAWPGNFAPALLESLKPGLADMTHFLADLPLEACEQSLAVFLHPAPTFASEELPGDLSI